MFKHLPALLLFLSLTTTAQAADKCRWLYDITPDFYYCNSGHKTVHYKQPTILTKYDAEQFMAKWSKEHPGQAEAHFTTTKYFFEPIPLMYEGQNWPMIYRDY